MQDTKIGYQVWVLATYILDKGIQGVSTMKLHRDLEITLKNAWDLYYWIRESWNNYLKEFVGPVEVDEAYLGGLEKNKHEYKKLNAGRGAVVKTAVVGAKDSSTNQIQVWVEENIPTKTLTGFVYDTSSDDAQVYTDHFKAYDVLKRSAHETFEHSVKELVNADAPINGEESFWSLLKQGCYGMYHRISPKH